MTFRNTYIDRPATFTDYYELTMAQGYFHSGLHTKTATFDYFFRELPFGGGYLVYAGLSELLETLDHFHFYKDELEYLKSKGFDGDFLDYLESFRFQGTIQSVPEGEIVFPQEPLLRVEGNLIEAQIIETLVLNILNYQSLIATKASRFRLAAGEKKVVDFGLRRSQGTGGIQAARAAMIGGIDATSNVYAARKYHLPVSGTMAHSWVQAFNDELSSFRAFADEFPDQCILLVDTYDTLGSGIPNAITVAGELEQRGRRLAGIRLDSGDLAWLAQQARRMLDDHGLNYVQIVASNQLDEYVISSLMAQKAPIDVFGAGTRLVTGYETPALDGVYKLSEIDGEPTLKISENVGKTILPGRKKIFRYYNRDNSYYGDAILLEEEKKTDWIFHPFFPSKKSRVTELEYEPLLVRVMEKGELCCTLPQIMQTASYSRKRLDRLNKEHKRFDNPHIYKVGISKKLMHSRDQLINQSKERQK